MHLFNHSPWTVERSIAMDGDGFEQLVVFVKASCDLRQLDHGVPVLAEKADPLVWADEYRGEPGASSLKRAGEGAMFKPAAEFFVEGRAYPASRGDTHVDVSVRVGAHGKALRVMGERRWVADPAEHLPGEPAKLQPGETQPLEATPIIYELAFGGADPQPGRSDAASEGSAHVTHRADNPVGMGYCGLDDPQHLMDTPLPAIESPEAPLLAPAADGHVLGLGPIAPHWQPRVARAGTYDEAWQRDRMPLLPRDFDPRYYLAAPDDQVLDGYLQGGERVVIEGMTQAGQLEFELPKFQPVARVCLAGETVALELRCDTMHIDTEAMKLTLLWRAKLCVQSRVQDIEWIELRAGAQTGGRP